MSSANRQPLPEEIREMRERYLSEVAPLFELLSSIHSAKPIKRIIVTEDSCKFEYDPPGDLESEVLRRIDEVRDRYPEFFKPSDGSGLTPRAGFPDNFVCEYKTGRHYKHFE